jgi:hypothetical protein
MPLIEFYTWSDNKHEVIIQIGKHSHTFQTDDVVAILRKFDCIEEFGGKIRLDLLQPKLLPFVNELVKLDQKATIIK